ncbi:hypothetical protein QTO34_013743 [Cnephaeus nilssonii]|uniref:Uncharacterized protein n=1 Tax=Cnephaeus nilssonii TaxID=3371016 RepID=A0AA40I8I4_CNENI|nr:hypothetical protein QTO34_013743 [Eptesicus nilssonii]
MNRAGFQEKMARRLVPRPPRACPGKVRRFPGARAWRLTAHWLSWRGLLSAPFSHCAEEAAAPEDQAHHPHCRCPLTSTSQQPVVQLVHDVHQIQQCPSPAWRDWPQRTRALSPGRPGARRMKITDKRKWNLFLRRSRPPWLQKAQPTPVQTPLGQHQLPITTNANRTHVAPTPPQRTAGLATPAPASAPQPTKRQTGHQVKQTELKWVKTKDSKCIVVARSVAMPRKTMRAKGIQNWRSGELSYFTVNSVVDHAASHPARGAFSWWAEACGRTSHQHRKHKTQVALKLPKDGSHT